MYFERFYHDGLAQASYLIGCQATGEALVVDPHRDLDVYLRAVTAQSLRLTHVTETHIHADYVSGSRALAREASAQLLLSAEGGPDWSYAFAEESGARLLRDGDLVRIGNIEIAVVHTPGHTPEHLTFVVTDRPASDAPLGAVTGDFIFVGDVGRPDLLERAAGVSGTMRDSAAALYRSLQRFVGAYSDHLLIWPGHGAGSACGKALGAVPMSTLGYEKIANWALQARSEEEFVNEVLDSQSEPPPYFAVMKRVNRDGPPLVDRDVRIARQDAARVRDVLHHGAMVIDLRPTAAFARGSIPGTVNLPMGKSLVSRAGWLVPYDHDVYLLAGDENAGATAHAAARELSLIGLDRVRGWFGPDALDGTHATQTVPQITARDAATGLRDGKVRVIDVRNADEWRHGHIEGAEHIPLGKLPHHAAQLRADERPVVLHCASGGRSAIGASVLLAAGVPRVANMEGGFAAWQSAGLPVTTNHS